MEVMRAWCLMAAEQEVMRCESTFMKLRPAGIGEVWVECPAHSAPIFDGVAGYTIEPLLPSLSARKATMADAVDALLQEKFSLGYPVTGSGTVLDGERLELRPGTDDKTNWLTAKSAYADAVAAGAGDAPLAKFRAASNNTFFVTFSQGLAILVAMQSWGFAMMQASWDIKDAIDDPDADHATLDAIIITDGWPT